MRVLILANSTDPDGTPHFAASHLGLCCLYMFLFCMHSAYSTSAYFEFQTSYAPANIEGTYQPKNMFSLIRAFVNHFLRSMMAKLATCTIFRFKLFSVADRPRACIKNIVFKLN